MKLDNDLVNQGVDYDLEKEIEYLTLHLESLRIKEMHKRYFEVLYEEISIIDKSIERVSQYCERKARKQRYGSYYPLEIIELANNLKEGTLQLSIVAGSLEATTSLELEILPRLSVKH